MAKVRLGFDFALGFAFDSDWGQAALTDSKKTCLVLSPIKSTSRCFTLLLSGSPFSAMVMCTHCVDTQINGLLCNIMQTETQHA